MVAVWFLLLFVGFFGFFWGGLYCFLVAFVFALRYYQVLESISGSQLLDVISRLRKRGRQEAKQVKSFLGVLLSEDCIKPLRPEDAK